MKKFFGVSLFILIVAAFFLRFYKLGQTPSGFTWDEAAVGYNAWTIGNWGRDEWGKILPITFQSFGEHKNPIYIYFTVPFVSILGLSEFSTRFSSALFGVVNVGLIYFLAKRIFKNGWIALLSSFLLTISPFNLQFSRFNHELNFAIFFFMLGFLFFLKALQEKNGKLLPLAFLCFGVDLMTYHSAKFMAFAFLFLLIIFYFKDLPEFKKYFLIGLAIFFSFILLIFLNKNLLGLERLNQTGITEETLEQSNLFKKTSSKELGRLEIYYNNYKIYLGREFLFLQGDQNPRHSVQSFGTFYRIEFLFILTGFLALILGVLKNKLYILLIMWALLAPIPATLGTEIPHVSRSMFMTGSWHMISAFGLFTLITLSQNRFAKVLISLLLLVPLSLSFFSYLNYYYKEYDKKYSIEWQYGLREVFELTEKKSEHGRVYVTDAHSQPYIFALFYSKTPLPVFLKSVEYNDTGSKSSNQVAAFGKYKFGLWDPIESWPDPNILYVLVPSKYSGLRYKESFMVDKLVKYPNGDEAFYLVSGF